MRAIINYGQATSLPAPFTTLTLAKVISKVPVVTGVSLNLKLAMYDKLMVVVPDSDSKIPVEISST